MTDGSGTYEQVYGVLFSHASENVWPDLVTGEFPTMLEASTYGSRVQAVQGVRYKVMRKTNNEWHSLTGQTARQALTEGVDRGFTGWV